MRCPHTPPRANVGEYQPDQCRRCWLALNRPDHPEATGRPGPAAPAERPPCRHLGEPAGWGRMQALGLSPIRDWRDCAKGHGTTGVVCGCKPFPAGCRGCPDYVPSDDEE